MARSQPRGSRGKKALDNLRNGPWLQRPQDNRLEGLPGPGDGTLALIGTDPTSWGAVAVVPVPADDFEGVVLGSVPDGLWKLDETSGTTAFDSSGNGRHLLVGADVAPTWAQAAGTPGTVTAEFSSSTQRLSYTSFPLLADGAFTCVGWVRFVDSNPADYYSIMGQGTVAALGGSGMDGWMLSIGGSSTGANKRAVLQTGTGSGAPDETLKSDVALTVATWYQLAITQSGGVFRMYVNGLVQALTSSATCTTFGTDLICGSAKTGGSSFHLDGRASWWAVYGRALSGTEILNQFTTATVGPIDTTDMVLTSDGAGGFSLAYPTIATYVNGA